MTTTTDQPGAPRAGAPHPEGPDVPGPDVPGPDGPDPDALGPARRPAGAPQPSGPRDGDGAPTVIEVAEPPAGAPHPRFRARRIAVRRDAGLRRLKRLLVLVAVAATSLAAVVVLRSPILDVDEVRVVGAATTGPDAVTAAAGLDLGSPILLADLDGAEARVRDLPWVGDVVVERELPGTVVVRVTERVPVAVVSGAGRAVLVDDVGRVLGEAPPSAVPPFVHVLVPDAPPAVGEQLDLAAPVGPDATTRDATAGGATTGDPTAGPGGGLLAAAVDLAGAVRRDPAGAVAAVHLEPDLWLQLVGGGRVELGDATALDAKVEALRTVHARVDLSCLATLDLRVPTHPVLTRRDGCS